MRVQRSRHRMGGVEQRDCRALGWFPALQALDAHHSQLGLSPSLGIAGLNPDAQTDTVADLGIDGQVE